MFKKIFIDLCNRKNESPSSVCRKVGITPATFSGWTEKTVPRQATLQRIADYFGVTVDCLLGESDSQTSKAIGISEEETTLLSAYRAHPEMHEAVHKLLGIDDKPKAENTGYRLVAFGGDNVDDDTPTEPHIT